MKDTLIKKLRSYFKKRKDIAFAFLFGSQAKGRAKKMSDVDIAVYFFPKNNFLEYEEEVYYEGENEIWGDIQKFLKKEVELLVLNRTPSYIGSRAVRGIPIIINNWALYLDYLKFATTTGDDFSELIINHYKEKEKIGKRS